MHTLMPYRSFGESAEVLKDSDLVVQCNSVVEILRGKANDTPVPKMWKGYLNALVIFGLRHCHEARIERRLKEWVGWGDIGKFADVAPYTGMPPWWGDSWVHRSHRSRLIGRDPDHYSEWFPGNPHKMPMIWPQLDDTDSRGYRLIVTRRDKMILDRGDYRMPDGIFLTSNLEVLEG